MKIWLAEINAYDPVAHTEITLRYCSGRGFITRPTETPANAAYQSRIVQPALVRRDIPIPGQSSGSTRLSYGDMVLSNSDGGLDALTGYDFSGRAITIWSGNQDAAYPAGFIKQLVAVVDTVQVSMKDVTVKIKSPRINWEQPIATATYGGTNTPGGTGTDGDASMSGTAKPLAVGYVAPISTVMVNSTYFIYQYHQAGPLGIMWNSSEVAVSVGGVSLVAGPTYPNSAEMYDDVTA